MCSPPLEVEGDVGVEGDGGKEEEEDAIVVSPAAAVLGGADPGEA